MCTRLDRLLHVSDLMIYEGLIETNIIEAGFNIYDLFNLWTRQDRVNAALEEISFPSF